MSLQTRILGAILLLLLLSLACGGALLSWHARTEVETEVRTAFRGAERSVRDTLKSDVEHTVTLRQVVASFEGQRHVRAALVNEQGRVIVQSGVARQADPAPQWFARLMMPPQLTTSIPINLPRFPCVVRLTSDPRAEISDVWGRARDAFIVMLIFCAGMMIVMSLAVRGVLRFFRRFQAAMLEVSGGSHAARLDVSGPPEFATLARGFNQMVERLAGYAASNRQLEQRIQSVQEEERIGIARDLHDEVGPYLFAIQVDAKQLARAPDAGVRELGQAIRDAALHVQRHVRDILRQLRPATSLDFGLDAAVGELMAFWSRRHPAIRFERRVCDMAGLERRAQETVYRIVQESLSNAVRHGEPATIRVTVAEAPGMVTVCVEDDGKGLGAGAMAGMGMTGMAERVRALGGELAVEALPGQGVRVTAALPRSWESRAA